MSELENAPLLEAVFEIRWGEVSPGKFTYTQDEQQLLPGKINVAAIEKGYGVVKNLLANNTVMMPFVPSHRFLQAEMTWPCFQIGLGIYTINQTNLGYSWDSFKETINQGLQIFNKADSLKLESIQDTGSILLRYQDVLYPSEGESIEDYLEKHFQVIMKLPDTFVSSELIDNSLNTINVNFNIRSVTPEGQIRVVITNAMIEGKPGLLMETLVESKLNSIINGDDIIVNILNWSQEAHAIQKHSFETLIKPSAYESEK